MLGGLLPRDFPPWKTVHDYFRLWLPPLAPGRHLGEAVRSATPQDTRTHRTGPATQRRYRRLAVGEDHRGGRGGTGLRPRQEG